MDTNAIQRSILQVVDKWVRQHKTPIEQRMIVALISVERDTKESTIKAATRVLVKKGYIRKAVTISQSTSYVQLRSL